MLAIFDDPTFRQRIPNPTLRAATAALISTVGAPVLHAKTPSGLPVIGSVEFRPISEPAAAIALAYAQPNGQVRAVFNDRYRAENPFLFTKFMFHEFMHSDRAQGEWEEFIALTLDTYVYLQQLARHPGLAAGKTELTQRLNETALARFNSGDDWAPRLYGSKGIFPGGLINPRSWYEWLRDPSMQATPGNPLLRDVLRYFGEPPPNASFNQALFDWLDANPGPLSPDNLLRAAAALALDIPE